MISPFVPFALEVLRARFLSQEMHAARCYWQLSTVVRFVRVELGALKGC